MFFGKSVTSYCLHECKGSLPVPKVEYYFTFFKWPLTPRPPPLFFLSDPGIPGVRSMGPSVSKWCFASYTSYRLYTSYTRYTSYTTYRLYTEKVTRGAPSGGQFCNFCEWLNLLVKFVTNASGAICWAKFVTNVSGAIWWPNLELMQVAPSGGQFYN